MFDMLVFLNLEQFRTLSSRQVTIYALLRAYSINRFVGVVLLNVTQHIISTHALINFFFTLSRLRSRIDYQRGLLVERKLAGVKIGKNSLWFNLYFFPNRFMEKGEPWHGFNYIDEFFLACT